jgi:GDPmannose 4,6-dehydratase
MWRMLQQPEPADYVIGTGVTHSVRELVETAFAHVGLDWRQHVETDPAMIRPAEVDLLHADARRARAALGWAPTVGFPELVAMMVDADLARLRPGA